VVVASTGTLGLGVDTPLLWSSAAAFPEPAKAVAQAALFLASGESGWMTGPGIIADAFRLMLVTAQRRGEVLSMRWQDVDGSWWTLDDLDAPVGVGASVAAQATLRG
jgi:hypothetical protein